MHLPKRLEVLYWPWESIKAGTWMANMSTSTGNSTFKVVWWVSCVALLSTDVSTLDARLEVGSLKHVF